MMRPIIAATVALALLGSVACARGDKTETATKAANETESTPMTESAPSMTKSEESTPAAEPTELAAAEPTDQPAAGEITRVGMGVFDATGQKVGVIDDIIIADDGTEQAVLSVGTYLGLGAKKITVPMLDLSLDVDGARYTTTLTADEIESAPEYVSDQPDDEAPMPQ